MIRAGGSNLHTNGHRRRGHLPFRYEGLVIALFGGRPSGLEEPEQAPRTVAPNRLVQAARALDADRSGGLVFAGPGEVTPKLPFVPITALLAVK